MNDKAKPQIDGKPELLAFARAHHPRHEHTIVDLERLLRRIGFEVTDTNEDRVIIAGPLQTTTACKTLVLFGGVMKVRHFELLKALERLLEVGLPVWKTESDQFQWHLQQLEQCAAFQIPAPEEFESREDLEGHIETCTTCQPANRLLTDAISLGSSRYKDEHWKELVEKSHADQARAIAFYTQVRDAQRLPLMPAEKPRERARREQVPA